MTQLQREELESSLYRANALLEDLSSQASSLQAQIDEAEDKLSQVRRLSAHLEDDVLPALHRELQDAG